MGTFSTILQREGALAFYKGFGSVAMFTVPAHALYFGGYEMAKRVQRREGTREGDEGALAHFSAGLVADLCGALLWCPQDVVKQKMQVQDNVRGEAAKYRNSWHTLTSVARTEGLAGLYRGFFAAVLVYAPLVGMHFMLYEQLKRFAASRLGVSSDKLPHVVYLCAAGLSSSTAALVTTPLDVVKTRLQVQSATEGGYSGILHAMRSMAVEEGAHAFFRGAFARMLWLGPNAAFGMLFYETFKRYVTKVLE